MAQTTLLGLLLFLTNLGPSVHLPSKVLVASILPSHLNVDKVDLSTLSHEELECWQLNAQVTKYLYSVLSDDVHDVIYEECEIDEHII